MPHPADSSGISGGVPGYAMKKATYRQTDHHLACRERDEVRTMFGRPGKSSPRRTLERQYDEQLELAIQARLRGDRASALRHSHAALAAGRELYQASPHSVRHQAGLAAALYHHAGNLRRARQVSMALALLAESARHYQELAWRDPAEFTVRGIDVLVRTGTALRSAGDKAGAVASFRQAISQYSGAPANDPVERDLGRARAHFHLGKALLELESAEEALAELDAGLLIGEQARQRAGVTDIADFSWLAAAPRSFQLVAPDWAAAAMCAMQLHHQAGRPSVAAKTAAIAVGVSGGMAVMGGPSQLGLYQLILARAMTIWEQTHDVRPGG